MNKDTQQRHKTAEIGLNSKQLAFLDSIEDQRVREVFATIYQRLNNKAS